jgi:hypothetical protein
MDNRTSGYEIIGDIYGHTDALTALLSDLGYSQHRRGYRHADRKVVFVGDFVDRGPAIGEVIEIARAMVDAGDALAVMGNHEYNAIAFHTAVPGRSGRYFRDHSIKNCDQHKQTLYQLSCGELNDAVAWFKTLPVAIDVGGFRVAHASWQTGGIGCINQALTTAGRFTPEFLEMAEDAGSDLVWSKYSADDHAPRKPAFEPWRRCETGLAPCTEPLRQSSLIRVFVCSPGGGSIVGTRSRHILWFAAAGRTDHDHVVASGGGQRHRPLG